MNFDDIDAYCELWRHGEGQAQLYDSKWVYAKENAWLGAQSQTVVPNCHELGSPHTTRYSAGGRETRANLGAESRKIFAKSFHRSGPPKKNFLFLPTSESLPDVRVSVLCLTARALEASERGKWHGRKVSCAVLWMRSRPVTPKFRGSTWATGPSRHRNWQGPSMVIPVEALERSSHHGFIGSFRR